MAKKGRIWLAILLANCYNNRRLTDIMIFCQRAAGLPDCLKIMRKGEIVMKKWVYLFTEGNADMRELLGGKGDRKSVV